jgi:hypothetical protein
MDLLKISQEIKDLLETKRKKIQLSFIEEDHVYFMQSKDGKLRNDFPSVSKLLKEFYIPFDANLKSLQMTGGDIIAQRELLKKWKKSGEYSTNMGSRVHYLLENELIERNNSYKEVRKPIFECDDSQIQKGDMMFTAGKKYLDLLQERNAVLLDTEMVLGDPDYGYTGQPDKIWLVKNKQNTDFGFLITDWKTNQPKNFEVQPYNGKMIGLFKNYDDTALYHYYVQLSLYGKLLIKMLEGTKYENMKTYGCFVVLLKENSEFEEFRAPKEIMDIVFNMNINFVTKKIMEKND